MSYGIVRCFAQALTCIARKPLKVINKEMPYISIWKLWN